MTTARVIETSVTVNNSPTHDYVHPDNHITRTYDLNPALKALTSWKCSLEDIIDVFVSSYPHYTNVCKISRITFQLVRFLILGRSF